MDVAEFKCPRKGCRARELSGRVSSFIAELVGLRDTCATLKEAEILPVVTRMLAVADLKLAWVDDMPFYIWQIDSQESATTFLKSMMHHLDDIVSAFVSAKVSCEKI